jgi:O-antigen/teichoic acid export membrane protein
MRSKNSLKSNFLFQALYELLLLITPMIVSPYVSRVLGASNLGIYSYTYTISNYFVLISAFGIKNYARREIARKRDNKDELNKTFSSILVIHFIISIIVVCSYVMYCAFVAENEIKLYSILMGLYVVGGLLDVSWLFFGLEQFKITVTRNAVIRIISIALIFFFVKNQNDLWIYILIYAAGNCLSQLYLWLYLGKTVRFCHVSKTDVFTHLMPMFLLFLPNIAVSLYNYMDKIMLGIISSKSQLGFYENSEKITFIASALIGSVGTVMMPRMTNLIEQGEDKTVIKYTDLSMQFVMALSFAMAGGVAGFSKVFAPVFWGDEFAPCSVMLALLAITLPFKGFANVIRTHYMIPNNLDKGYTISVCFGAVVNLIANYMFIRIFDGIGAVMGTILAEMAVCIYQALYCRKMLPIRDYLRQSIPYGIIAVLMMVIVYWMGFTMKPSWFTLLFQVASGILMYGVMFMIVIYMTKNTLFMNIIISLTRKIPFINMTRESRRKK